MSDKEKEKVKKMVRKRFSWIVKNNKIEVKVVEILAPDLIYSSLPINRVSTINFFRKNVSLHGLIATLHD